MNLKIIKLHQSASPKKAVEEFSKVGYNCIPLNVNRRTHEKHKVIETLRNHKKYSENLNNTLLFEGIISILNRKDFWIGKPDFIIWNNEDLFFCEFKSKGDNLRLNQIEWMEKYNMLPCALALAVLPNKENIQHQ